MSANQKGITIGGRRLPPVMISTYMGHSCNGMFPFTLSPGCLELRRTARLTGTAVAAKSATPRKRVGNCRWDRPWTFPQYVRPVGPVGPNGRRGLVNAYGLTNGGPEAIVPRLVHAYRQGYNAIPSLAPPLAEEQEEVIRQTVEAIDTYYGWLGGFFWILEMNLSCPNDRAKIQEVMEKALACIQAVRRAYPQLCLIAKVSILHPTEFIRALVDAGVTAIHAINTIPYHLVGGLPQPSPLAAVGGGGVSGGPAFPQAFAHNRTLRNQFPDTPMIMGCGVMGLDDVEAYFRIGANVVSTCTFCRFDPWGAREAIGCFNQERG